ncbi:unnamed protein product [Cunninghamella echinulata]
MPGNNDQQLQQTENNTNGTPTTSSDNVDNTEQSSTIETTKNVREEEEDDDEDNDTNFKRRNINKSETASATISTHKRRLSSEDNGDHRLNKQIRTDTSTAESTQPSIIGRLGTRRPRNRCFDYDEKGYCMRGDFCPYEHGDNPIIMESNADGNLAVQEHQKDTINHNTMQGHRGGGPMRTRGGGRGGMSSNRNHREQLPYTSRYTSYSTKIVVENIPSEHCTIDAVTDYFGKFGKLTNLSVQPDHSRAFIQYTTHQEALAAYQSPAVIFNNRFVKVYWQKVDEEEEKRDYLEQLRLAAQPDPELVKAKAAQLAKEKEEKQKKHQEHLKKILELQKQKQQLMERQIDEQKKLMQKLQHAPPGSKEREEIMTAMANLSAIIKANQASTTATATVTPPPPPPPSSSSPSSSLSTDTKETTTITTENQPPVTPSNESSSSSSSNNNSSSHLPLSKDQVDNNKPLTVDEKKAEMERLKAKLASLEAAKLSSQRGGYRGRGGMYTWSTRGGRSYSLDNRKKPISESLENEAEKKNEHEEHEEHEEGKENDNNNNNSTLVETTDN